MGGDPAGREPAGRAPVRKAQIFSRHFRYANQNSCYCFLTRRIKTRQRDIRRQANERHAFEAYRIETLKRGKFFIFFGCNPLKRPVSAKGIQEIQAFLFGFPWFFLDFLGSPYAIFA
jgi:hypothetical protein